MTCLKSNCEFHRWMVRLTRTAPQMSAIEEAVKELTPLYELETTSDLQGLAMAKAMNVCKSTTDFRLINDISDEILEGIYANIEQGGDIE